MSEIVTADPATSIKTMPPHVWETFAHTPVRVHVAMLPRYYNQTLVVRRYCECKICLEKFSSSKALQNHKFEMHSY